MFHVTVNNFISTDNELKTISKNPLITRPLSSDIKDKKKDNFGKDKNLGFEGFFNLKVNKYLFSLHIKVDSQVKNKKK